MDNLLLLFAVAVLLVYVGAVALIRRRRGRKRPLLTADDYAVGCLLVSVLTAIVSFAVVLWWLDARWWFAVLAALAMGLVTALQIGIHLPDLDEDRDRSS